MRERSRLQLLKMHSIDDRLLGKGGKKKRRRGSRAVPRGSYAEKLLQAGIEMPANTYLTLVGLVGLTVGYIALVLGPLLAVFAFCSAAYYLIVNVPEDRAAKRRRAVVNQLPAFIDGMASALSTGFNTEGALIQATVGVPPGILRTELDRMVDALNRGASINEAMVILKTRISGREVTSLAVAVSLFSSMGGRLLEPFRRLARKLREQQQIAEKAHRDLVQVKQAFAILLVLSLGTPVVLTLMDATYMSEAMADSFGRLILQISAMIQLSAIMVFKRITSLKI